MARISLDRVVTQLLPFVGVVLACLMVITYVPVISIGLRDLVYSCTACGACDDPCSEPGFDQSFLQTATEE